MGTSEASFQEIPWFLPVMKFVDFVLFPPYLVRDWPNGEKSVSEKSDYWQIKSATTITAPAKVDKRWSLAVSSAVADDPIAPKAWASKFAVRFISKVLAIVGYKDK